MWIGQENTWPRLSRAIAAATMPRLQRESLNDFNRFWLPGDERFARDH